MEIHDQRTCLFNNSSVHRIIRASSFLNSVLSVCQFTELDRWNTYVDVLRVVKFDSSAVPAAGCGGAASPSHLTQSTEALAISSSLLKPDASARPSSVNIFVRDEIRVYWHRHRLQLRMLLHGA